MAELPNGDGTAEATHVTGLSIDLADQLNASTFQQGTDDPEEGEGDIARDNGTLPPDNESADLDTEATDGNDRWQEQLEDELSDGSDNRVKREGVGEENPDSCFSPLGTHDFMAESNTGQPQNDVGNMDVIFTPAKVLNFDDSDGDDLPAVDHRFVPRGIFVQSDFLNDRPVLHGSEEAGYYSHSTRTNVLLSDHSQNVRIIEGHDDLDLDPRTGYMSLAMRNNFLQTQMVQLPPSPNEDLHVSANLYDSLEREEELYLQDEKGQNGEEDGLENSGGNLLNGEDGSNQRDTHPVYAGGHFAGEDHAQSIGFVFDDYHQRPAERGDHGINFEEDKTAATAKPAVQNMPSSANHMPSQDMEQEQHMSQKNDAQTDSSQTEMSSSDEVLSRGSTLLVALPKHSNSLNNLGPVNETVDNAEAPEAEHCEQLSARPKQPVHRGQQRGGPAGSNEGEVIRPGNRLLRQNLNQADPGKRLMGVNSMVRNSMNMARQVCSGAQNQRPAVQGAAVATAGIGSGGDGDGAVAANAGIGISGQGQGNIGSVVSMISSRTSSQGSLHSNASNKSNSRVSGVGKESNSNRYNQSRISKAMVARPGSQHSAATSRMMPAQPQSLHQGQKQQQPAPHHPVPKSKSVQPPTGCPVSSDSKQIREKGSREDSRTMQLQQRQHQLKQEQHHLLQMQRELQQRQQQLQSGGMESPDGDHLVHHHPETVVTQMGYLQQEGNRQERSGGLNRNTEVQDMEEVRGVLQSMLRFPKDTASFDHRGFDFADSASDLWLDRPLHFQHDGDNNSTAGFQVHGQDEMSEMFESFPSFSYKMFSQMANISATSDRSVVGENAYLRECLEKERYRRKHCEQQIQYLNTKLLEVQQQLAVAVSTDKRKDIMIDQLDKQLAKVVEGWKKREADKDEYLGMLTKEKTHIEETLRKQQTMIDSFEKEVANMVEELKQEKEHSSDLVNKMKAELSSALHSQQHAEEMLAAEKERATLIEREWEQLKESRDLAEKRAQQALDRLHQEQDNWYQREQELLNKIDHVKDANLKVMHMEQVKLEEQTKKAEDMEERVHAAQTAIRKLEMEVDSAVREKESLKIEMALMEAKFENAQRTLEADLEAQMERKMSEEVSAVQERMHQEQEEQEQKHHQMIAQLHQEHQRDLERQITSLRQDVSHKEKSFKEQLQELESRLREYQDENSALKQAKQKLESQRIEVLGKLQFIMQSQWNEAVSLLVSTPQRKTLNTSLSSSLGPNILSGPGVQSHLGTMTSSASHPFSSSSQAISAAEANAVSSGFHSPVSHKGHHALPDYSHPVNNLSDCPSSQSSRQGSPNTKATTASNSSKQFEPVETRLHLPAEAGMTLQNISTLLAESHYLSPQYASHQQEAAHNGGLVVHTHHSRGEDLCQQRQQPAFQPRLQTATRKVSSDAQAIMIRPPQQLSHPADAFHDDHSFISTSGISPCDLPLLSHQNIHRREQLLPQYDWDRQRESSQARESQRKQDIQSSRGLELRDLEFDSHSELRDNLLMVNKGFQRNARGSELLGQSVPVYSPSMSPPVKQGRGGEQDSTDGDVLRDSDRLNNSYREISRQLEQHQNRQKELQHYIKMLLERPPQAVSEQPERDSMTSDPDAMEISFSAVAVDLGLSDPVQAAPMSTELHQVQRQRDRQPASVQSARPKLGGKNPESSHTSSQAQSSKSQAASTHPQQSGVLSPHQLAEISRLLSQYSEDVEAGKAAAQLSAMQSDPSSMMQMLSFLASLPQGQPGRASPKSPSVRNSPKQLQSRRARDTQRSKKQADARQHSVGRDTSNGSSTSIASDKFDKTVTSSTRSAGSAARKGDKKSFSGPSTTAVSSAAKHSTRSLNKEQQHPVWK